MGLHEDVTTFLGKEFQEGYPDELIVDSISYKYVFSDLVREVIDNGDIRLAEIELAVLMIPSDIWTTLYQHQEFYYHCNHTNLQMIIFLDGYEFTVKIAYKCEQLNYA